MKQLTLALRGVNCYNKGDKTMFEKDAMDILMKFLDRKVLEAEQEVTTKGTLSEDKAIPLMLKMQFNHIRHLEESVNDRFGQINQRFEQVNQRFEQVNQQFEQVNQQFEQVNQRFDKVNQRFDKVDQRFERITNDMNGRFMQITKDMNDRFMQFTKDMNDRFAHGQKLLFGSVTFLSFLMMTLRFIH
jgi:methyl-accepting chemotaxis protein